MKSFLKAVLVATLSLIALTFIVLIFELSFPWPDLAPALAGKTKFDPENEFITVFVHDLLNEFEDNPVVAKDKYDGHIIGIRGIFRTEKRGVFIIESDGERIFCIFAQDLREDVLKLNVGDIVLVKGVIVAQYGRRIVLETISFQQS